MPRRRHFVAISPKMNGLQDIVGPFPTLSSATEWGHPRGFIEYQLVFLPAEYEEMIRISKKKERVNLPIDTEPRCGSCGIVLYDDAIKVGYCTSECERDAREKKEANRE